MYILYSSTVLYCAMLYCAVLNFTVLCYTVLLCAVLFCALCCTVLYSTVQYSTVLYWTVRYECIVDCSKGFHELSGQFKTAHSVKPKLGMSNTPGEQRRQIVGRGGDGKVVEGVGRWWRGNDTVGNQG